MKSVCRVASADDGFDMGDDWARGGLRLEGEREADWDNGDGSEMRVKVDIRCG